MLRAGPNLQRQYDRDADGLPSRTIAELDAVAEEFEELDGRSPERELLRIFWLLSSVRPREMETGTIRLTDTLAAQALTWLTAPLDIFASWIMELDSLWMADHVRRAKAERAASAAKAKR